MKKPQIEAEIATAQAKIKSLRDRADKTWSAWHGGASAERKSMEARIDRKYASRYQKLHTAERRKVEEAESAVLALRCKYAAALCSYPIDSVMGEWVQGWGDWKPTGRTGTLEVFRTDTEWPATEHPKPTVGTVIIRIIGKNNRPTKQAQPLSKAARDVSLRKYVWLPVGQRPK